MSKDDSSETDSDNQESDEPTGDDGEQGENENQHEQGLDNGADLDEQQDNVEETVLNPEQNSMDEVELNEASDNQPDEVEENISESWWRNRWGRRRCSSDALDAVIDLIEDTINITHVSLYAWT